MESWFCKLFVLPSTTAHKQDNCLFRANVRAAGAQMASPVINSRGKRHLTPYSTCLWIMKGQDGARQNAPCRCPPVPERTGSALPPSLPLTLPTQQAAYGFSKPRKQGEEESHHCHGNDRKHIPTFCQATCANMCVLCSSPEGWRELSILNKQAIIKGLLQF